MPERPATPSDPVPGFIAVGRVVAPWGVRGEVRVQPLTDFARRFSKGAVLYIGGDAHTVAGSRRHNDGYVVRFEDLTTPEAAVSLRDRLLEIPEAEAARLPAGAYYRWQLEGLDAVLATGERVGVVREVLETGANDVLLIVDAEGRENLVPFIDEFATVDDATKRVVITPIPGMLAGCD